MTKQELNDAMIEAKENYRTSLQTLWDNINKGQQKQLLKIGSVKEMLDRYQVDTEA